MGALFESLIRDDDRFEILADRHLGLVIFRLKVGQMFFLFLLLLLIFSFVFFFRVKMS